MLARGFAQTIRHQRQRVVRHLSTIASQRVDRLRQAQLVPEVTRDKERPPIPRADRIGGADRRSRGGFAPEDAHQGVDVRSQQILPTQLAHDAMSRATLIPLGFDQSEVFVYVSVGAFDLGDPQIHVVALWCKAN